MRAKFSNSFFISWSIGLLGIHRSYLCVGICQYRGGMVSPPLLGSKKGLSFVIDSPSEEVVIEILRKIDIEVTEDVKIIPIVFA